MPFGSVTLQPGINVERTPTLLTAGFAQSQLIRFRDGLVQKLGGWARLYPFAVNGVPRDLHAWEDLAGAIHLFVGTTTTLGVITSGVFKDVTPITFGSFFLPIAPNGFSTIINTPTVTVTDPNVVNLSTYDVVRFDTPVSVGGILLQGVYPITAALGGNSYQITAAINATSTVTNGGAVPLFTTTSGSNIVKVTLNNHGITGSGIGTQVVFPVSTTSNAVTIFGDYTVTNLIDANNFNITVATQANASGSFSMNGGYAALFYYLTAGPPAIGFGWGHGGYGSGGYGTGV